MLICGLLGFGNGGLCCGFFFFFSNSVFFSGSGGDGFGGLLVVVVIAGHGYNGERRREKCEVYIILLFDSWFILF